MRTRRISAALVTSLVLALPTAAHAQGAGDNQYTDPFAGENGSGSGSGSSGSGSGSGSSGSGTQGGAEGSNGSELSSTMPTGGAEGSGQLARTGADPGILALLGAGFVVAGVGLRVRVRRPLV
jgi:hypothetical protein